MRTDISPNRPGWLYGLDYKKLIVVVFLLRIIFASAYDIFVTITDKDILLPDSKFYSLRGRYVDLLLQGYNGKSFTKDLLPKDRLDQETFIGVLETEKGGLPKKLNNTNIYAYVVGIIYLISGYRTIWVRVFNICISMLSVYLLFKVAKRHFGGLAANLFLLVGLFLPTQFIYSVTLSRDFLIALIVSLMIWMIYNIGDIWIRKLKSRFCC